MAVLSEVWDKALALIKNSDITEITYDTWFASVEPLLLENGVLYLKVQNEINRNILRTRYQPLMINALRQTAGENLELHFLLPDEADTFLESRTRKKAAPAGNSFISKYTFDTFVVGNSNRLAHAASLAVAESPAQSYNPLFLYGGSGLGKTHLLHAIAQYVLQNNPHTKVLYVTAEKFTNELIVSIQANTNEEFRNRYRSVDILMIDDIQFLAGKEQTQEEFFHTFNALYEANKQIIITSDKKPNEIPTLEDRLRSRFIWGLLADVQPPDMETRVAILKKKVELDHLTVSDDVLHYIAMEIQSNIRNLEGSLNKVMAFSRLQNKPIDLELAKEALKDILIDQSAPRITPERIMDVVGDYYGISREDIKSRKRPKEIAYPRQIAMWMTRKLTDLSLPMIGESFGGKDHTTVLYAIDKINKDCEASSQFKRHVDDLVKKVQGQ